MFNQLVIYYTDIICIDQNYIGPLYTRDRSINMDHWINLTRIQPINNLNTNSSILSFEKTQLNVT